MNYKGEKIDWHRFQRSGNQVLFKSKVAFDHEHKQYNKWYVIATIPEDLRGVASFVLAYRAIVRAFIDRGHRPLNEDEIRAALLDYAVTA